MDEWGRVWRDGRNEGPVSEDKNEGAKIGTKEQPYEQLSNCMVEWANVLMDKRK